MNYYTSVNKKLILHIIAGILIISCQTSTYQKTEEDVAKVVFEALKHNDYNSYKENIASYDDLKDLWVMFVEQSDSEGFEKLKENLQVASYLDNFEEVYPALIKVSKKLFKNAIRDAQKSGILVDKMNYEFFEVKNLSNEIVINIVVSYKEKKSVFETKFYKLNDYLVSQGEVKWDGNYIELIEETVIESIGY